MKTYEGFFGALFCKCNMLSSLPNLCKDLWKFPVSRAQGWQQMETRRGLKDLWNFPISTQSGRKVDPVQSLPPVVHKPKLTSLSFKVDVKVKTSASVIWRAVEVEVADELYPTWKASKRLKASVTELQSRSLMDAPLLQVQHAEQSSCKDLWKFPVSRARGWQQMEMRRGLKDLWNFPISAQSGRKVDPVQSLPPVVHKPKLTSLSFKVDVKDLVDQNNLSSSSPWQDISTWNRRPELRKAKEVSDDSLVCGACHPGLLVGQQDSFFLNDIWSPTLVAGDSLEEVRGESTSSYHQVNGSAQQSDVQIGCRTILARCKKRFSLMNYKRQGGQAVQSGQPARVKDGRFVLKATPKEGLKVVLFSGGGIMWRNMHASLPGMDLLGTQHKFIQQVLTGEKMALLHPFASQLLVTGMLLEEAEPSELILASISHGGNSCHAVTANIERATGEPVRGVVMWDFITPAFKEIGIDGVSPDTYDGKMMERGLPLSRLPFLTSHVPNYRCRSSSIQIPSAWGRGEELLQILERESYDASLGLYFERHKTHKVHAGHMDFDMESAWDILRLIMTVPG